MFSDEEVILNMMRRYTSNIMNGIEKAIIADKNDGFSDEVSAYHALRHRCRTLMGFAFEDIAEKFGNMINLNINAEGKRSRSRQVRGVDLENNEYCFQLKSSRVTENGTGKRGYDASLKESALQRNKTPVLAIAICDVPRKNKIKNGIIYSEGREFWETHVGISYDALLNAKHRYERELQQKLDSFLKSRK